MFFHSFKITYLILHHLECSEDSYLLEVASSKSETKEESSGGSGKSSANDSGTSGGITASIKEIVREEPVVLHGSDIWGSTGSVTDTSKVAKAWAK